MTAELCHRLLPLAQAWLDPRYPLRQQARGEAAAEFRLSPPNFELALNWIFAQWTEDLLTQHGVRNPFKGHRYAVQVLAGTTPAMIAQGFLQGALLQLPQCLKIPSQQTAFARLLQQSFADLAPDLARLFELNDSPEKRPLFYSQLAQADLVLLYGQDETIASLKKFLAPQARVLAHGHAESAAILFKEAATPSSLHALAYDFLSYDQRGCLSPRIALIEAGGELSPAACVALFAHEILPPLARSLPRGGLFAGEAAALLHQRSLSGFRGPIYSGEDWTVCLEEQPQWPTFALPRFLPFQAFANTAGLQSLLNPMKPQLISLGYAGPKARLKTLELNPSTRFCRLGEMQKQLLLF